MAGTEDWRMCVDWLVRCKILPEDHKATFPSAQVFDLAQALRDGVLICHLLNHLSQASVDAKDFSPRPQMSQFLCLKNIRTFLQTCKRVFRLRDSDLFDPPDLFDVKDFRKVLYTISKLSKTDLAQKKLRGFSPDTRPLPIEHDYYNTLEDLATGFPPNIESREIEDDEDIYGNLKDMAFENDLDDNEELYDVVYEEEEDDIYEHLCAHRRKCTPDFVCATGLPPPQTKRDHCIKELVDTEKNYVDALQMIVTHFIKPLKKWLTQQDRERIFANIEKLLEVHTSFHAELLKACSTGTPKISEVFTKWKPKLLIYGDFCSNLPVAQEHVDELCKRNDMLRQNIEECQRVANDGKFRLRDLLSVPMQRVLKYHLLLKELIKQTDKSDEDRKDLEKALEAMQDLSLYVNEVKRDNEALLLIEEIQNSIVDLQMPQNTSLKDYGRLQKDGELKVRSHIDTKIRPRYIFLFDKVMLMCKSRMVDKFLWGETYSYKEAIALAEFKVDEHVSSRDQQRKPDKWNHSFTMVQKNQTLAYTFFAKTEDMRGKWIDAINLALDNTLPSAVSNYVMHTFDKPKECDVCGKLLRGVFFQGYLCQDTNRAVHKECIGKSPERVPAPPVPPRAETVICKARALCNYNGIPTPDGGRAPLEFEADTVIEVLIKSDDWWKGRCRGDEGWFPCKLVREIPQQTRSKVLSYETACPPHLDEMPAHTKYVNGLKSTEVKSLASYAWYVGSMERDTAAKRLEGHPSGTYLIRESRNPNRQGELSLSICFNNAVRHIKVNKTPDGDYYLADIKFFHTLPELVEWYQSNSLVGSFPELDTTLMIPFKESRPASQPSTDSGDVNGQVAAMQPSPDSSDMNSQIIVAGNVIGFARVIYDYSATATNQLTLHVGDRVAVISKAGGDKGWWKGKTMQSGKIGYFPLTYVKEEDDD